MVAKKPTYEELGQRNGHTELEAERHEDLERTLHLQAQILSYIKDTIVIITPEMKTIYANQAAKELFGGRSEMFTEPCYRFFKNRDTACEDCPVLKTIQDEKPHKVIMKSYDKNGQEMWRFNTALPFYDLDGQVVAGIEIETDYTSQKNVEMAFQKSEERYRALFESMSDGVAIYEAKNEGEDFTFVDLNKAAEKIDNIHKETLIGKSVIEVFPGVKEFGLFDVFKRVRKTGKPEHYPIAMYKDERIVGWRENFVYKLPSGEIVAVYSDETELKQTEAVLRESEEKYRNLVEDSFDGIFIQRGSIIIFANKRLNDMLGYREGELIGQNHWVVYHPDYQKLIRERAQARMRGEEVMPRYEVKLQRKDGSWFHGEVNARVITFTSDGKGGIQVWVKDIDERKHSEEALRESEVRYRNLVENSLNAIILYRQQEILFANEPFFNIFGYEHKELQSMAIDDILAPEVVDVVAELRQRRIAGKIGKAAVYESKGRRKDGEIFDIEISVCVISHQGEQCCMAFLSDISGRKQAEEALRESERKFSTLFHASPVYIAFTTFNDGRFLDVNDAFTKVTGFERNEVLGRTPIQIGLWFTPEERSKYIELAQKHGGFHEEEVKFRKKNGDPLYGFWSAEKIELGGKACLISVFVDTTERKKVQEALRQERDKLLNALSEIKTLSGLVPICSNCKKIRDDQGYWNQIEKYIGEHSNAQFSHGICPECAKKLYPEFDLYDDEGKLS